MWTWRAEVEWVKCFQVIFFLLNFFLNVLASCECSLVNQIYNLVQPEPFSGKISGEFTAKRDPMSTVEETVEPSAEAEAEPQAEQDQDKQVEPNSVCFLFLIFFC